MCLSFVRKTPLLTLTARNQFLTKTINLHFTSLHGTSSLSRGPLLPYTVAYGNSIPEETNARFGRLWKLRFFPGNMGSSFYSFAKFVVTLGSFVARVRQLRGGGMFLKLMNLRDKRTQSDDDLRETIKRRSHVSRKKRSFQTLPNSRWFLLV